MGNLRWFFTWVGFFGGVSILVWAVHTYSSQSQRLCIERGGLWTRIEGQNWDVDYYRCTPPTPDLTKKKG